MCDSCRHDLEVLHEQMAEAEKQAARWFQTAIRKRQQFDDQLDVACECRH